MALSFEYTFQNHFRFGYDGVNDYRDRTSREEIFSAEFGRSTRRVEDWRASNELAAQLIYERKQGDIIILLSGGMDSEICLRSFLDQGLPVRAVTLMFTDLPGHPELDHVKRLRKQGGFNHDYIEVELGSFIESREFNEILESSRCLSPVIASQIWLAHQVDGTPVIAQGEVHLKKEIPDDYVPGKSPYLPTPWNLVESERLCSLYRSFIKAGRPAIPGFFQYLPEQFYSYLTNNPLLENLVNNKVEGKLGTRSSKNEISHQFYPDLPMREKLTGWEAVQKLHDELRTKIGESFVGHDAVFRIGLNDLIQMLK